MKRPLISTLLVGTCVTLALDARFAKEKPGRHIHEQFEATISSPVLGANTLSLGIEEYTTDDEMEDLAQTFARRGAEGLETALRRQRKGYFQLANWETSDIVLVMVTSMGGVRRLGIVGVAPNRILFGGTGYQGAEFGHAENPWTFIQIEVNELGKGKGSIIPLAKLVFNQQGRIVVKPAAPANIPRLVNVHVVK